MSVVFGRRMLVLLCGCSILLTNPARAEETLPRRGLMGVQLAPVSEDARARLQLPDTSGALLTGILPDTAAARAGLQPNDVLIRIADERLDSLQDLFPLMRRYYAGDTIKLALLREGKEVTAELTLLPRPRETAEDYEVIYDAAGPSGRRVRTIITRPKGDGKHPAVLFVQGMAPQSIEFAGFMQNHPYRNLIQGFTRAGLVTMRVERPGVGDSEGIDPQQTRLPQDVEAFRAALAKLKTYDFVDGRRVYLFGHSSGGAVAPLVVQGADVAGVIVYGTFARPWLEHMVENRVRHWKLELLDEDEIKAGTEQFKRFMQLCYLDRKSPADVFSAHPDLREATAPVMQGEEIIGGVHYRYWQDLANLKLAEAWSKVNCPVLALWGEADYAASRADAEFIAATVNRAHPGKGTVRILKGIDHMYQKAEDQEESFLAGFGGTFNPIIISTVESWIRQEISPAS